MIIIFDNEYFARPLFSEFPDATRLQYPVEEYPQDKEEYIIAVRKPSPSWIDDMRTRALILDYFYGSKSTLNSHILFVCDAIYTQTETQKQVILSLNEHKDVKVIQSRIIPVMTLARDNAKYIEEYIHCIQACKDYHLNVHVLENDSVDGTADMLKTGDPSFKVFSLQLGLPKLPDGRRIDRTGKLAHLRNRLLDLTDVKCGEYTMVLDTQVMWNPHVLKSHIELLDKDPSIAMVTSWGTVRRSEPCEFHFDTFATVINGKACDYSVNLWPCTYKGAKHDYQCHKCRGQQPMFQERSVIDVDSACGGLFVIRTDILRQCKWAVNHPRGCEHWEFCRQVKQHGRIVINPMPGPVSWEG